jgi:Peptidase A4 family
MRRVISMISGVALGGLTLMMVAGVGSGMTTSVAAAASSHGTMIPAPVTSPVPLAGATSVSGAIEKSANWSGYAQNNGTKTGPFTGAEATFVVPTVAEPHTGNQYSADWVGIGGYNEDTLVQDGVEADNANGTPVYQAWTEILPAASVPLKLTIHPGDKIKATVRETAVNSWTMSVADLTQGTQASRTVGYDSHGASAEMILERPEVGSGLTSLAKTTKVVFNPGGVTTTAPGSTAVYTPFLIPISGQNLFEIEMTNNSGSTVIATPSAPSSNGKGMAVADGSVAPNPPKG